MSRDVRFYETIYPYHIFHFTSVDGSDTNGQSSDNHQSIWIDPEDTAELLEENNEGREESQGPKNDQPLRKSSRDHRAPSCHSDYYMGANVVQKVGTTQVSPQFTCFMAEVCKDKDPSYFSEATQHSHWLQAMNEELDALENNKT